MGGGFAAPFTHAPFHACLLELMLQPSPLCPQNEVVVWVVACSPAQPNLLAEELLLLGSNTLAGERTTANITFTF